MKLLILLALLIGCSKSPKFKEGDCTAEESDFDKSEFLEEDITVRKVLKVGKRNYLYEFGKHRSKLEVSFRTFEYDSILVPCPEYLK